MDLLASGFSAHTSDHHRKRSFKSEFQKRWKGTRTTGRGSSIGRSRCFPDCPHSLDNHHCSDHPVLPSHHSPDYPVLPSHHSPDYPVLPSHQTPDHPVLPSHHW